MKLFFSAITKFICGLLVVALLVFLPAGSLNYIRGWAFMSILFIPIFILGTVLLINAPDLLKKRLEYKEEQNAQKGVVAFSGLIFIIGFIVAGLDFRFGWSKVSMFVTIIAVLIFLVSYGLYAEILRENAYLSRTVNVQEGQEVIVSGLYGIVRHPMYSVTIWMFLAIPLVLGSWWSFLCFLPYIAVIVIRIQNEEKLLTEELKGYREYKTKVKYRILPFVW